MVILQQLGGIVKDGANTKLTTTVLNKSPHVISG